MEVRFENEADGKIVAYISGEINTATAKELEAEFDFNVGLTDDLVLDFTDVPYISSAGLRVLMKKDGDLKALGSFALRNVNDEVYSILKMVKFTDFITIEGREKVDEQTANSSVEFHIEDYNLTGSELELLPPRVRVIYENGDTELLAALDEDDGLMGFAAYKVGKSGSKAYLLYMYVNEQYKDIALEKQLEKKVEKTLSSGEVHEIIYLCYAGGGGEDTAKKLHFEKTEKGKIILSYTKAQILNSSLWKKIDKLRVMFNRILVMNELDDMQKIELNTNLVGESLEEIDPLYARIFVCDNEVKGLLNAQEVTENDIWISRIKVLPCKEANYGPLLMIASLLDAMCVLLRDDDQIHLVLDREGQESAFRQVLGEPLSTDRDVYYVKEI